MANPRLNLPSLPSFASVQNWIGTEGNEVNEGEREVSPIHKAQLLSYMKLFDVPLGLLLNSHEMKLADGVSRMVLPGANRGSPRMKSVGT